MHTALHFRSKSLVSTLIGEGFGFCGNSVAGCRKCNAQTVRLMDVNGRFHHHVSLGTKKNIEKRACKKDRTTDRRNSVVEMEESEDDKHRGHGSNISMDLSYNLHKKW